jgi:hypothetical protein
MPRLEGAAPAHDSPHGLHQDLDVEPQRVVLHVVQVFLGVEVHGLVGAPVDLPPAGDALGYGKALALPQVVLFDQVGHLGTRPHQRHLAEEDVEELGQLVERGAAQEMPDARDARVVGGLVDELAQAVGLLDQVLQPVGVRHHGAELDHLEGTAILAGAQLAVEDRAAAVEADGEGDDADDGQGKRQRQGREEQVEGALGHALVLAEGRGAQVEHGDAGELLDGGLMQGEGEVVGHDPHAHRQVVQLADHLVEAVVSRARQGDDDIVHAAVGDDQAYIVERAEHAHQAALVRIVVEVTGKAQPIGVLADLTGDGGAHDAGAEDEHAAGLSVPEHLAAVGQAVEQAPGYEQQVGSKSEEQEEEARDVAVGHKEHAGQRDGGQERAEGEAADLIVDLKVAAAIIDGEQDQDAHPQYGEDQVEQQGQIHSGGDVFDDGQVAGRDAPVGSQVEPQDDQQAVEGHGDEGEVSGEASEHGWKKWVVGSG